jgi:hypothetical protein
VSTSTTIDLKIEVPQDLARLHLPERVRAALRAVFADPNVDEITTEDLLGDYPAVQYVPPTGTFHIDILTRLGELWRRNVSGRTRPDLVYL